MCRTILALLLGTAGLLSQVPPAGAGRVAPPASQNQARSEESLAVIVNRSNPIETISFVDLRKIFLGEKTHWPDGHRITVVMMMPGRPERKAVLREIYQMSDDEFDRYFLQATFTGEVFSAPKTLATAPGVRKFVFNLPSAIGYVRAEDIDDSVKVVRVNGRLPGEKGYRLRLDTR